MVRVLLVSSLALLWMFPAAGMDEAEDLHQIPAEAKAILDKAENFELFSLDLVTPADDPKATLHGWKVLGKTTIAGAEVRKTLVEAFEKAVADYKGKGKPCFFPRHGIRVKHGGKVADFVICFECFHVQVFVDGGSEPGFVISDSLAGRFNKVLKDAGVKVPGQPKK